MRYFRVFTLSLLIHLAFAIFLSLLPEPPRLVPRHTTYVELLDKPELPARPHQPPRDEKNFVRNVDVPEKLLSKEKRPARFASAEDRSVIEETRARATDMTANRSNAASGAPARQQKLAPKNARAKLDFRPRSALEKVQEDLRKGGDGDILMARSKKREEKTGTAGDAILPSFGGLEKGISTFGESVPDDVKFGDLTALNTDRHLFYTFYARMEEKIRFRWVTYARAAVYSLGVDPRKSTGRDVWVTKLEVLLDRQGHYQRSILHSSSGIRSLDQAPLQAFRDAGQFPNPPQEMVKDDGLIHIYYSFSVHASNTVAGQD